MTIFLTTQYLDEADTLADRVGIISSGRLVAQGSPADLKHSVGHDVIVAEVEGEGTGAVDTLRSIEGLDSAWSADGTITVNTSDGPAALGTVARGPRPDRAPHQEPDDADADLGRRLHGDDRVSNRQGGGPLVTAVEGAGITGREAGFVHDVRAVAGRALRQIPREPAAVIPAVFVPAFFYAVNLGALEKLAGTALDYKAFLLPMAIAFAVTGMSRAPALVSDIQGGYFDRLCMTPIRRSALLLGLMVADVAVIIALCLPVLAIGAIVGVHFATGLPGLLVFVGFSALWGLAFTGFPYAVALKTGSPAAVNACYVVFFPLFFLTDAVVPKQLLTGWFSAIATYNPVTYLLGALRALITSGWQARPLLEGLAAVAGLAVAGMALALAALRARIRMGD